MGKCVFCDICNHDKHRQIIKRFDKSELYGICDVIMIKPKRYRTKGHLLFIPDIHVESVSDFSYYTADVIASVYKAINMYLYDNPMECNVLSNSGKHAGQTVFHLHVHLIPRYKDDGLKAISHEGYFKQSQLKYHQPMKNLRVVKNKINK